jgi:hypothetical protein
MMFGVEPPLDYIQQWAEGTYNVYRPLAWQHAAWACWYLGYDDPDIRVGDVVTNGMIQKITDACVLRLKELNNE